MFEYKFHIDAFFAIIGGDGPQLIMFNGVGLLDTIRRSLEFRSSYLRENISIIIIVIATWAIGIAFTAALWLTVSTTTTGKDHAIYNYTLPPADVRPNTFGLFKDLALILEQLSFHGVENIRADYTFEPHLL